MADDDTVWKIGQLASRTGLTVRTLHHYDHVGLVRPSDRTAAGHRLYTESDVERLYQVRALRQLGLSLDTIAEVLAGTASIESVMRHQLAALDRQLAAIRSVHTQLSTMLATVGDADSSSVSDFLGLIRKVTTMDDTFHRYFDEDQLEALARRREELGEQTIADAETAWPELIARVRQAMESGVPPESAEARALADEWFGLVRQFHGDDEGLKSSLYKMYAENAERIAAENRGPDRKLIEYITQVQKAR